MDRQRNVQHVTPVGLLSLSGAPSRDSASLRHRGVSVQYLWHAETRKGRCGRQLQCPRLDERQGASRPAAAVGAPPDTGALKSRGSDSTRRLRSG